MLSEKDIEEFVASVVRSRIPRIRAAQFVGRYEGTRDEAEARKIAGRALQMRSHLSGSTAAVQSSRSRSLREGE